jgi:hypothetical protein
MRRLAPLVALACLSMAPATRPATAPASRPTLIEFHAAANPDAPLVLHLPGIAGYKPIDRTLLQGLADAGPKGAALQAYDWPAWDPGLPALFAYDRNRAEAKAVAEILTRARRASPARPIHVTAHSGGVGVLVWALEQLPDDVQVEQAIFLAPALSPGYDLSPALRRVRGNAYAFTSPHDPVLGTMTRVFGTIDRVKTDSAGLNGFVTPAAPAFPEQYRKLAPMPWRTEWTDLGHPGDHIGPLATPFARTILAPLLVRAK